MQYRRTWVPGGTYFVTVNLANRAQTLLVDYVEILREAFRKVKLQHPFQIDAIVILPDHLHTLWTLPPEDADYATRWMLIKGGFSRSLPNGEWRNQSRRARQERGIWQRRYWEHLIRDDQDFDKKINYIHYNPVKHGYVSKPADWPFSSIHQYLRKGLLPPDWGCGERADDFEGEFGER